MIANVKGWQTDIKTGLIVPDTTFVDKNTLQNDIKYYLAYKVGTDTTNQAMDNLFDTDGAIGAGHIGEDGPTGVTGQTGPTGVEIQGAPGPEGQVGPTGYSGPTGDVN